MSDATDSKIDEMTERYFSMNDRVLRDMVSMVMDVCESPIERLFLAAFLDYNSESDITVTGKTATLAGAFGWLDVQASVLNYRADFVLRGAPFGGINPPTVVVECDGHDFHERTKEQAARDHKRDREMSLAGFIVLRFTGSELFRDPEACVRAVSNHTWMRERTLWEEQQKKAANP